MERASTAELASKPKAQVGGLGALPIFVGVWMTAMILVAFLLAPPVPRLQAHQILYFHVPCAWVASIAFLASGIYAGLYLSRRKAILDIKSAVAAELGLLFCILATLTGAVFSQINWGVAWNWDPRETTITALLMLYFAYFALRAALPQGEGRAAISAVYAIIACVVMPFLVFVIPRAFETLHPTVMRSGGIATPILLLMLASTVGFTALAAWIFRLRVAADDLAQRALEDIL